MSSPELVLKDFDWPSHCRSRGLGVSDRRRSDETIVWVDEHTYLRGRRHKFEQEVEPLSHKSGIHRANPSEVAARSLTTDHKTGLDRITRNVENNGYCPSCGLGNERRWHAARSHDDCHPVLDKVGRQFRQAADVVVGEARFHNIAVFDVASFHQPCAKRRGEMRAGLGRADVEIPNRPHVCLLWRRSQRPRGHGTT
jgi:hypothetical protein